MQHRTRVLPVSGGYAGICSCGYTTDIKDSASRQLASNAINDHEYNATRGGVKVTHLDQRQLDLVPKTK